MYLELSGDKTLRRNGWCKVGGPSDGALHSFVKDVCSYVHILGGGLRFNTYQKLTVVYE